ncbi:(Fe-S)-binding protein [Candidatus Thiodictyon syntrophicum]|jgi:L-lactate dehydrogenase complex protein LldE|uniref:Oxidoreductase n=1 Tax=Candidatus Thiodictyon syntrophicum TaxID=1166950 RepID=A0A2K8U237_9GAMM|nr:(Fe-S)-binding protein [Candidatus Thiodictyon syntrophicum]AUB79642.1 oxidoreductase [Candidatus Thiodictyon syntrophicum]
MPDTVYFFGTCLIDTLFPRAGLAAMQLLRRAGVRVIFPQGQTCCGQPAYNSGYRDEARAVARAQLDAFPADLPVVVPSASCAGMLRVQYPLLFADTADAARAEAFAGRVVELADFLVRVLDVRLIDLGPPIRVAVHNSCSARRELGVADATMDLLGRLARVELVEPERAAECCGFGGAFSVKQPEISAAMAGDKARAILATGAAVLVGQDCGCLMNLGGTLARQGGGPLVRHLAEFIWERTHRDD